MKALIIRHCAFGDAIHASHLPRLLHDQGYTVDVNTNFKGSQIFARNPFINKITVSELSEYPTWIWQKYFDNAGVGYDKVINLYGTIETELLALEHENTYYLSNEVRRQRWGGINYYDHTTEAAGYPELIGKYKGEMFFSDEEEEIVKRWVGHSRFDGKFKVLINLSGTGPHKRFVQAKEVAERLIEDEDVFIITTGSDDCKSVDFLESHERKASICGRFPFRQAALITKYMDCVIGCESGLMCASAMWHTPTVQLMTATSIIAHNKYNPNDYSLQSPCRCSPCHKGPYQYIGCPSKNGDPLCVYFDVNKIIEQVQRVKNARAVTV
jgi:ADP-heptose:LPS heptosyltransferase